MDIIEDSLDEMLAKDEDALENLFLKAIGVLETSGFFAKMKKMLMENLKNDPNNKELAKQMEQKRKKAISLLSQS